MKDREIFAQDIDEALRDELTSNNQSLTVDVSELEYFIRKRPPTDDDMAAYTVKNNRKKGCFYLQNNEWYFQYYDPIFAPLLIQNRNLIKLLRQAVIDHRINLPVDITMEVSGWLKQAPENFSRYFLVGKRPNLEKLKKNHGVGFVYKSESNWNLSYLAPKKQEKQIAISKDSALHTLLEGTSLPVKPLKPPKQQNFLDKIAGFFRNVLNNLPWRKDPKLEELISGLTQLKDTVTLADITALTTTETIDGKTYRVLPAGEKGLKKFKEHIEHALNKIEKNKYEYSTKQVIKITKTDEDSYSLLLTREISGEWQLVLTPKSKRFNEAGELVWVEALHNQKKNLGSEKNASVGFRVDVKPITPKFILTDKPELPRVDGQSRLMKEAEKRKELGVDKTFASGTYYQPDKRQIRTVMVVDKAEGDLLDHLNNLPSKSMSADQLFSEAMLFTLCILYYVQQLHDKNQVHRDLKFENFLIMKHRDPQSGETITYPKLDDFGMTVQAGKETMPAGTEGYMSPNIPKNYDEPYIPQLTDDLYALSVMFTGLNNPQKEKPIIPSLPMWYYSLIRDSKSSKYKEMLFLELIKLEDRFLDIKMQKNSNLSAQDLYKGIYNDLKKEGYNDILNKFEKIKDQITLNKISSARCNCFNEAQQYKARPTSGPAPSSKSDMACSVAHSINYCQA